jgi:hypothetical protein
MTEILSETHTREITPELITEDLDEVLSDLIKNYPEVASFEISNRISQRCQNTGPYQLQRIFKETGNDVNSLANMVSVRENLTNELGKSQTPIKTFLEKFTENSMLFESMVDGNGYKFSRYISTNFPLLSLYARNETSINLLTTQDYAQGEPGLPGYDWSLFDKSLVRISNSIKSIANNDPNLFSGQIGEDRFRNLEYIWETIKSSGLSPLFITSALHLDVAKGGSSTERKYWKEKGINPFVHNSASAFLVKQNQIFEKVIREYGFSQLDNNECGIISEFFENIIAYHGFIGQWTRGEVTEFVIEGFTDWVSKNNSALNSAFQKLGITENVSDFISDIYYLINVVDTASVRDGLYTDRLDNEFIKFKVELKSVIDGKINWSDVFKQRQENISERNEKKIEFLADRITRLRGGKDYAEVLGTLLELDTEKINYIFDLLKHAQLWYVENATVDFSVENQLKLLTLAAKESKGKGTDKYGNFDVNFAPLMNTLRPNKNLNKALARIIDTSLCGLPWNEVINTSSDREIIARDHLKINLIGENGITGINCLLDKEMTEACNLINAFYTGRRENSINFRNAVDNLFKWTGIKLDEWDRVFDQETYMTTMNASMEKKVQSVLPVVEQAKKAGNRIVFVGVGSGTGELEHALSNRLEGNDLIVGTDISTAMVENMKRISRVISAQRYLKVEGNPAPMKTIKSDASTISRDNIGIIEDQNTVVIYSAFSVNHEFASYIDNFAYGNTTTSIYKNLMSQNNLHIGDEIVIRDFIESEDPDGIISILIGEATENEADPGEFIRNFANEFKGFTPAEREELSKLPEILSKGTSIQITRRLAMEIMGHYSWLKNRKNLKEINERYGYYDAVGFRDWFNKIAEQQGIKVEIDIQIQDAKYEDYIGGEMDAFDSGGNPIPVPLSMATIIIKRIA